MDPVADPKTTSDNVDLMLRHVDEALTNWANSGFTGVGPGPLGKNQFAAASADNARMVGLVDDVTTNRVGTMFYDPTPLLAAPDADRKIFRTTR